MTQQQDREPLSWGEVLEVFQTMSHDELAARMPPGPRHEDLVAAYPELAHVAFYDVAIDGPHGDVSARIYRGSTAERSGTRGAGLVWVHGGAFVGGDLDMAEAHWVGLMLAASGIPVLSVDYRKCLSGVHFPVPSDDVLAAWQWALAHVTQLGVTANDLHLGGASAGGNLVAGVSKRLRDGAGRLPASLVLCYPVLHADLPPLDHATRIAIAALEADVIDGETARALTRNYAGHTQHLTDPYAFPANGDVSGLPPVFVLNSEADTLRASGEAFAAQLAAAGVPTRLELEPGTVHGQLNEPFTDAGRRSVQRMVGWLMADREEAR